MKIVGALLARNEADRYLERVLENAFAFCDEVVVLDDGSTDDTAAICEEAGARVERRLPTSKELFVGGFWGADETTPRQRLWKIACAQAGPDGWIYIFDADHELLGLTPDDLRQLCKAEHVNAWAFPLWDCWDSESSHRVDGYWRGWEHPRSWLFRAGASPGDQDWGSVRGIHTGHVPRNFPGPSGVVPPPAGIRHLGYIKPEDRARKMQKYLTLAPS